MTATTTERHPVEGGALPYTLVLPDGDQRVPFLVIVPSIFGVGDDLVEQMEELAAAGAGVAAIDPFWRVEPGFIDYGEMPRAFARLNAYDHATGYRDFLSLVAALREHPRCNGKVAGLGICFGGVSCLFAAADGALDGVITWHGSRMHQFVDRAADMRCPMVHHIGGADPVVPPEALATLREAFAGRDDVELIVHDGAAHGFSQRRAGAHHPAAERAGMDSARAMLAELAR